jgi:hypothetical protein
VSAAIRLAVAPERSDVSRAAVVRTMSAVPTRRDSGKLVMAMVVDPRLRALASDSIVS